MPTGRAAIVLNIALFQLGWWCAVLGAARQHVLFGPCVIALVLLIYIVPSRRRTRALALVLVALALGAACEVGLRAMGMTAFSTGPWSIAGVPLWMIALWGLFATTLTSSLRWLQGRWLLGSLFGAVGGSLSYVAGARLGALDLPASASLWVIALLWALALPLLSALARRWEMPA